MTNDNTKIMIKTEQLTTILFISRTLLYSFHNIKTKTTSLGGCTKI